MNSTRAAFPIFNHHPNLVYLDNAATTQTPRVVVAAMNDYYYNYRANIHRGLYPLSEKATAAYEDARKITAEFIKADPSEVVFTSGATHGLNMLAHNLGAGLKAGDNVVLTRMEHHANLVPWQQAAKLYGFELRFIEMSEITKLRNYELNLSAAQKIIDDYTKVVSLVHVSNTLGTINPIEKIIAIAKKVGAVTIIDAAQSAAHVPINVKKIGCDFLIFSGHKMYGPTGIGVLYGRRDRLEKLAPFFFGGDMVREVTYEAATWNEFPEKFEAGTPNIAGAIGLGAAIKFIKGIGFPAIRQHERLLLKYLLSSLKKISRPKIIGPQNIANRVGIVSFILDGAHPHDIATILAHHNIAVRAGHHCTMPLMRHLGLSGTVRISLGMMNNKQDIDNLCFGLREAVRILLK